ncbi:cation:proton antiporter [Oerskovia flava]|uniref:cation:proton antiporter n=1 Tax=Oerskovia flava TaxID=2986422 RepID=UPI00223EF852|nr:sodium:proton antiporter [Oerskovia sp. JB1-3-2]
MSEAHLLLLVTGALVVTAAARRWDLPAPLVLVAVGLCVSLVPGVPHLELPPEVILGIILPPLLYSAATSSSYQDLRRARGPIVRLGVGLVLVTALAVAGVAMLILPDLPFAAALVLGAVVAPPDAVSAAAVGRRLGLPRRVMTLLSGESLINDATSLTLYKVALAGVATGAWAWADGLRVFAAAVVVGVGIGLAMGVGLHRARLRLQDPLLTSVAGLVLPFAAYWIAEEVSGSGVLAVVAAGLYLGHTAPSAGHETRLVEEPLWRSLDLLLEALTFALIGLQLKFVVEVVVDSDQGLGTAVVVSLAALATTVLVRPAYVFATAWLDRVHLPSRWTGRSTERAPGTPPGTSPDRSRLGWRESLVVSAAGMRGVVTLAAAAAIPTTLGGADFPERATLQLAAFTVAIGTLLLQGTTLPWVIRALGVGGDEDRARDAADEARVRGLVAEAQAAVVEEHAQRWASEIGTEKAHLLAEGMAGALRARARTAAGLLVPDGVAGGVAGGATDEGSGGEGADAGVPDGEDSGLLVGLPDRPHPTGGRGGIAARAGDPSAKLHRLAELRSQMLRAQRAVLVGERDAGRLDETVMRRLLRELDLESEQLAGSWVNRV